jgi:hypothetical protein
MSDEKPKCSECKEALLWPEEARSGFCTVCVARAERVAKQNPRRYAFVPGLVELLTLVEEIHMIPGTPDRARGKAERAQEIAKQLIRSQRHPVFNASILDTQLGKLVAKYEKSVGDQDIVHFIHGVFTLQRLSTGHVNLRGTFRFPKKEEADGS